MVGHLRLSGTLNPYPQSFRLERTSEGVFTHRTAAIAGPLVAQWAEREKTLRPLGTISTAMFAYLKAF